MCMNACITKNACICVLYVCARMGGISMRGQSILEGSKVQEGAWCL